MSHKPYLAIVETPSGLVFRRFELRAAASSYVARMTNLRGGIWGRVSLVPSTVKVKGGKE